MFSPTWIVEVSSRTKSVEHVITVQPSLHAMLLHSFELNHQPKYVSSHKNGKRKKTKLTFPYGLSLIFCLAFPSKLTIPLENHRKPAPGGRCLGGAMPSRFQVLPGDKVNTYKKGPPVTTKSAWKSLVITHLQPWLNRVCWGYNYLCN